MVAITCIDRKGKPGYVAVLNNLKRLKTSTFPAHALKARLETRDLHPSSHSTTNSTFVQLPPHRKRKKNYVHLAPKDTPSPTPRPSRSYLTTSTNASSFRSSRYRVTHYIHTFLSPVPWYRFFHVRTIRSMPGPLIGRSRPSSRRRNERRQVNRLPQHVLSSVYHPLRAIRRLSYATRRQHTILALPVQID